LRKSFMFVHFGLKAAEAADQAAFLI